ncbi:MAG: hypothetical protein ABJB76_08310 [Candidatus Nitrosocosmicus sp.]
MNEEHDVNILEKLIEINFENAKMQKSVDPNYLNTMYQIRILTNQFLSFYKVTFVEGGIDQLDIITISILSSFIMLVKEYYKNSDNQSKTKSLNYIIESINRSLSIFVKERQDLS